MYLDKPSGKIDQAVIVESVYFYATDETLPGLVVTPTCDFEHGKCELAHVCAVREVQDKVRQLLGGSWKNLGLVQASGALAAGPIGTTAQKALSNKIHEIAEHRFPRYNWLSPLPGRSAPMIVDFQEMQSVTIEELEGAKVLAELVSPFREEVAARYSAYMGRVGTPDLKDEDVDRWAAECIATLFPNPKNH